jgi:hypothetical protein
MTKVYGWDREPSPCTTRPLGFVFEIFLGVVVSLGKGIVKDVAKISTNKLSTFDFSISTFYFTTCFNPEQGPLQVILHFELT